MSAVAADLPVAEIQHLVFHNAPTGHVLHVIATFPEQGGRSFLRDVRKKTSLTSSAEDRPPGSGVVVSLGFTYRGLERLHVPAPVLGQFQARAPAFTAGARMRAAQYLGDTGPSDATRWDPCFASDRVHAVFTLHATHPHDLMTLFECVLKPEADKHKVKLCTLEGAHIGAPDKQQGQWVHFGFRDGLSQVAVRGGPAPRKDRPPTFEHAAGEFLLGHVNNRGFNPWLLPAAHADVRRFFRNGSFGVLRQMEQDVVGFQHWVQAQADWLSKRFPPSVMPQPPCWSDYVKAKVCGRWPDGRRITGPDWFKPGPAKPEEDVFDYQDDPEGLGCPFGAHARRMNPRLDPTLPDERPLIRRGRPYGPMWQPNAGCDDSTPRGLLGQFFCASLEDQFEHLLGQWAERPVLGADDRGNAKDPLMGQHEDPQTRFSVPLPDKQFVDLPDLRAFVRTRGTVYAFYPSLPALELLLGNPTFMNLPEAPLEP